MSACSDSLRADLTARRYRVLTTPLDAFLRSGGSAFCLTLRLDRASAAIAAARRRGSVSHAEAAGSARLVSSMNAEDGHLLVLHTFANRRAI